MDYRGSSREVNQASFIIDTHKKTIVKNRYGRADRDDLDKSIDIFFDHAGGDLSEGVILLIKENRTVVEFSKEELKVLIELAKEEGMSLADSLELWLSGSVAEWSIAFAWKADERRKAFRRFESYRFRRPF